MLMVKQFGDPYYQGVSAQLAFFMFLSVIPIIIILSHMFGLFSITMEQIEQWANITVVSDGGIGDAFVEMVDYTPSGANTVVLSMIAIWAASRLQFNLIKTANYTLTDAGFIGRGFFRERLKAMASTLVTMIAVVVSLAVMVYSKSIVRLLIDNGKALEIVNTTLAILKWPIALGLYYLMISFLFFNLPSQKVKYKDLIPGSIFSAVGMMIVTFVFSLYTKYISNYNILYGSFSTLVAMMIFFWMIGWVFLGGIVFTRAWWATRKDNPLPISDRAIQRQKPMGLF